MLSFCLQVSQSLFCLCLFVSRQLARSLSLIAASSVLASPLPSAPSALASAHRRLVRRPRVEFRLFARAESARGPLVQRPVPGTQRTTVSDGCEAIRNTKNKQPHCSKYHCILIHIATKDTGSSSKSDISDHVSQQYLVFFLNHIYACFYRLACFHLIRLHSTSGRPRSIRSFRGFSPTTPARGSTSRAPPRFVI